MDVENMNYMQKSQGLAAAAQYAGSAAQYANASNALATPKQPTIASALGRVDSLNERLSGIAGQLSAIANAVGGPYPASGVAGNNPAPQGMVDRLHDSTETSHRMTSEIEGLINAISRALG